MDCLTPSHFLIGQLTQMFETFQRIDIQVPAHANAIAIFLTQMVKRILGRAATAANVKISFPQSHHRTKNGFYKRKQRSSSTM